MGGDCSYFGKPHAEHFEACLRDLGLDPSKVAHVGDSLHHDIAGANDAGISSIFISGGIHCDDLDCEVGEIPDVDSLKQLFEKEKQSPTHVAPLLQY
jgi:ribonucleotide monophosphatase NagD (HAD superfamily)